VVVSSASATGAMDVSPNGDPPGFVRVLDAKTLAIPDRPGNHMTPSGTCWRTLTSA
jgi:predicted pyridoxine 5'-phosphate oxidase superfamily flavin-nucleotide-binding protein